MYVHETGGRVLARRCWTLVVAVTLSLMSLAPARADRTATPAAFHEPLKADRIVILKSRRLLELLRDGKMLRIFPIALGEHPIGTKQVAGDGKTPEGVYYIDGRVPNSRYHLALHISYPNVADKAQAVALGRNPGGDVEIHGLPNWYRGILDPARFDKDWTNGCISVGDRAIEAIYAAVDIGTPIEIRP